MQPADAGARRGGHLCRAPGREISGLDRALRVEEHRAIVGRHVPRDDAVVADEARAGGAKGPPGLDGEEAARLSGPESRAASSPSRPGGPFAPPALASSATTASSRGT